MPALRLPAAYRLVIALCMPLCAHGTALDAAVAGDLRAEGLQGAVWSLVTPSGTRTGAAGIHSAATGQALTPAARVHVGSVAKTVLAAGALRLASSGALSLDSEVAPLLPGLAFDNRWQHGAPVRVRHLLAHTAGLEDFRFHQVFSGADTPDVPLAATFARAPDLLRVRTRPGSRYAYSNTGYLLLAMVIEAVTGRRYEDYLDSELLQPLGMRDSTFRYVTQTGPGGDARLAMGHFEAGATHAALPMHLRPAAQFTTTAADMARLSRFLMGDGRLPGHDGGTPFIAPALLAALARPAGTDAARAGLRTGHGLALAGRDRHGAVGACHPGTTYGFRAMLCLYPDEGKAFFVAVNTDSETADYERFNRRLIDALQLARAQPPAAPAALPEGHDNWHGIYVPAAGAIASLAWVDTVFNPVYVKPTASGLDVLSLQAAPLRLAPAGGGLWRAAGRIEPSHVLLADADGRRTLSNGMRNHDRVSWTRILLLWASAALCGCGLLYVLAAGTWDAVRGRLRRTDAIAIPYVATLALALPLPFLLAQSFLRLGEITAGSVLLAGVTGLLPVAMLAGALRTLRSAAQSRRRHIVDRIGIGAALQGLLVLAAWDMLPFVLWR